MCIGKPKAPKIPEPPPAPEPPPMVVNNEVATGTVKSRKGKKALRIDPNKTALAIPVG